MINNAGISHIGLLGDMSNEEWHRVMGINLDSVFYCCREAIPYMLSKNPAASSMSLLSGEHRCFNGSCLFRFQRGCEFFHKSTGKRACPKQYPGKCRCIWYDRHPYEFLFFCGRTDCFRRRNPDRTLRHNRRSCRMYLPPCNCPGISDRTDPNHGWRLVLKTSHFLSLRISEKRKPLTYPCQRLPSLFVPSCFSALFSF